MNTKIINKSPKTRASDCTYDEDTPKNITITPINNPNVLEGELLVVNTPIGVAMAPPISRIRVTPQFISRKNEEYINKYSMGVVFLYLLNNMKTLSDNSSQNYKDMIIQFILKFIDVNFKNANLTKLADDFHQSLSSLSKMIKQSTGYTFQELLQRKRYQKAIMLLLETNLSVKEISVAVGYENLSYFYRQFRKHYQVTPKQYRQLHKNDKRIRI